MRIAPQRVTASLYVEALKPGAFYYSQGRLKNKEDRVKRIKQTAKLSTFIAFACLSSFANAFDEAAFNKAARETWDRVEAEERKHAKFKALAKAVDDTWKKFEADMQGFSATSSLNKTELSDEAGLAWDRYQKKKLNQAEIDAIMKEAGETWDRIEAEGDSTTVMDYVKASGLGVGDMVSGLGWLAKKTGAESLSGIIQDASRKAHYSVQDSMTIAAQIAMQKEYVMKNKDGTYKLGDADWDKLNLDLARFAPIMLGAFGAVAMVLRLARITTHKIKWRKSAQRGQNCESCA